MKETEKRNPQLSMEGILLIIGLGFAALALAISLGLVKC
jgi:hypothetical protein